MAGDKDTSDAPAEKDPKETKAEDGEKGKEKPADEAAELEDAGVVVKEAKINTPPQPMPPLNDYYGGMPYPPPPYSQYPNGGYYWPRPPPGAENESNKDPSSMVSPEGKGPYPPGMYPPPYGYPPPPYQMMPGAPYYSPNSAPPPYHRPVPPPGHGRWPPSGPSTYEGGALPPSYSHDEQHPAWRPPPTTSHDPRSGPPVPAQEDAEGNKDAPEDSSVNESNSPSIAALYVKSKVRLPQNLAAKRERKNAQSRARAAKLRQRIDEIEAKPEHERTQEEVDLYAGYQNRRNRKNDRSRERAIEKKQECDRILSKPENKRTAAENAFLEATLSAKAAKNEGDRRRRQRIKQAKRKQAVAGIAAGEIFTHQGMPQAQAPTMNWPEAPV